MADPKKPGPGDIVGFDEYCREPACPWHVVAIRTANSAAAPQPRLRCPQDHPAGVVALPIRGSTPLPDEAGPVHEVVILPARPYGGFVLQLGDDDASKKWEGGIAQPAIARPSAEAMHTGARYVAELQRDLIQLGYLSESRWEGAKGSHPWLLFEKGKFTMPVVAAVLTLKSDLTAAGPRGYNVPSKPLLQGRGGPASAGTAPLNPDVKAPFPVFFEPTLRNPRTLAVNWKEWSAFFQSEAAASKAWTSLKTHIQYTKPVKVSYSLPANGPGQPMDEDSGEAATIDQEIGVLTRLEDELVKLDSSATLPARKQAIARGLDAVRRRLSAINGVVNDVIKLAETLHNAVTELAKDVDKKVVGTIGGVTAKAVVRRSQIDWQLGADRAATEQAIVAEIKKHHDANKAAVQAQTTTGSAGKITALCDEVVATINGAPDLAEAVEQKAAHTLSNLSADAKLAHDKLKSFVDAVDNVNFEVGMQQYRMDVREFGRVDPATAYCIKKMVAERKLNGRLAFVGPEQNEIIEWEAKVKLADGSEVTKKIGLTKLTNDPAFCEGALKLAATEVLPGLQAMFPKTAFKILHAMLFNESGWVQYAGDFDGFRYITMGIDWSNLVTPEGVGLKALVFDEFTTAIPKYASNRGWGLSQNSAANAVELSRSLGFVARLPGQPSEDHSGANVAFRFFNSLPLPVSEEQAWPATLVSPKAALAFAMNLVIGNFNVTVKKVPCTFPSAVAPSFDCAKCLARFSHAELIDTQRLKRVFAFEADIGEKAKAKLVADKKPKDDAEKAKLLEGPEGKKAVDDAYDAQRDADRASARKDAEAQLAQRTAKKEKNVPTIDEFMKTPEFETMVARKRLAASNGFVSKQAVDVLPEVDEEHVTAAITPNGFTRVFGRRPATALECVEQPCSWPAARAFYAGRAVEGITHASEVVRDVLRLAKA